MKNFRFGFIGCGNMGGTLAAQVIARIGGDQVAVCDSDTTKTAAFAAQGATVLDALALSQQCRYVVLGVKPQVIFALIEGIRNGVDADTVIVSMAAGISIDAISQAFGGKPAIVRIMPNTPAKLGQGVILYDVRCDQDDDALIALGFEDGFGGCGRLIRLDESKIDAASAVSGCGPAFVYMFIEALADAGVECGLPYQTALDLAAQTVLGSAEMVQSFGNPAALKAAVCSPGGTTIAGVHALEEKGFRAAAMDAVLSAYRRTLALKK